MLAGLLAELDSASEVGEFYDHVCEALCRLTTLERAGLLIYDSATCAVHPVGSHGIDKAMLAKVEGTLDETPIAQRALAEDSVQEASENLDREVPPRFARFAGITTLTCAPVAAGGRWFGVVFADRGGGRFELSEEERQTMLTLGRLAALATSVARATTQRERANRLHERVALTTEIHERVMQRLFGMALALGSGEPLSAEERRSCHDELQAVLGDLRSALGRTDHDSRAAPRASLRRVVEGRAARTPGLEIDWPAEVELPERLEGLAQSVFREAMRNAEKHAKANEIEVRVARSESALELEITNDGIGEPANGSGLGLRLLAMEALQHDALLEFGPIEERQWHLRLVAEASAAEPSMAD